MPVAQADDEEELELKYEENDSAMEMDTTQGETAETPVPPLIPYRLFYMHTHERVDQVFSKFSQRLGGHSAKTLPKLFRELRHAFTPVCNFEILEDGRGKTYPLSDAEAEKRFDERESYILFLAAKFDICADDIEEWVHTFRELREKQWKESRPARNAAELPHNAKAAVGRIIEVMDGPKLLEWNPVTTIGPGKINDDSLKQFFDAGQGILVIMDVSEHHENITEAERLDLLGDREATRSHKVRSHKDMKDPDESKRQNNDPRKIEAARKTRLVQAYLSKSRKRARELAEMDIDPNAQVARLHCADIFDLDYHHH
eukprot:jgi/Tetstr1/457848/TSEL_004250.t1